MEITLVAEGWRKLAMLARLIDTGSLLDKGCLFWDEPESNLNPKLIREVAKAILNICRAGVQVIVATHSLFLLREFEILLEREFKNVEQRCFALRRSDNGVEVSQSDDIDDRDTWRTRPINTVLTMRFHRGGFSKSVWQYRAFRMLISRAGADARPS